MPNHLTAVRFDYDYGSLTRWLLKVAYNSARSQGHDDTELLRAYVPVIMAEGECCPVYANFYLALVGSATLDEIPGRAARTVYPHAARSGPVIVPGDRGQRHVSARMLMINGYFFTILLSRRPVMPVAEVRGLLRRMPGEPLALGGRMTLFTSMHAGQALAGTESWPRHTRR